MAIAYLGLGSSLGDRFGNLRHAVTRLESLEPVISVTSASGVYESPHLGRVAGDEVKYPAHLNAVVKVNTSLSPELLLNRAQQIEDAGGRTRDISWGPRIIDIDILLYDDVIIHSDVLELPHPEMANRAFVIVPMHEVGPNVRMPDGRSIEEIFNSSAIRSQQIEQVAFASELLL